MTDMQSENGSSAPLRDAVSVEGDTLSVYGSSYSGDLFRGLGFSIREDQYFQILKREDGVITVRVTNKTPEFIEIAQQVADGNFNQAKLIEKARRVLEL